MRHTSTRSCPGCSDPRLRSHLRARRGPWLLDDRGERYLDLLSGFGVFALGRGHPGVKAALHQAIDLDLPSMVQIDCAAARRACSPRRSAAGAIRASRARLLLQLGRRGRRVVDQVRPGVHQEAEDRLPAARVPRPHAGRAVAERRAAASRRASAPSSPTSTRSRSATSPRSRRRSAAGDVAAFIAEPIQGKGVYEAPAEYWRGAERACREAGALLIMDEVQTGIGRTGTFWCHEQFGVAPDLICASKALSGGYVPVAGRPRARRRLPRCLLVDGARARALDHLQAEPARDGRRPRHPAGARRRGRSSSTPARWGTSGRSGSRRSSSATRWSSTCGARAR